MRVILTKNIPTLGSVGDVREVAAGYGRNYLIPQGMAVLATPGAMQEIETLKRLERRRLDKVRAEMEDLAKRVGRIQLTFPARVGETGRLYGSITASDIAEGIEAQLGQEFDRRKIVLEESLRTLGEHVVPVHFMPGVDAQVSVTIVPDAESAAEAEAARQAESPAADQAQDQVGSADQVDVAAEESGAPA